MKSHPRIRKTIKWGGAAVTVLLVVAWIGSRWETVGRTRGTTMVQLRAGCMDIAIQSTLIPRQVWGWHARRDTTQSLRWWYSVDTDRLWGNWRGVFPLWWLIVPAAAISAIAWGLDARARRRAMLNLCPSCNYDRTGLAARAVCPECGSPSA